jgi:hypothetical protein
VPTFAPTPGELLLRPHKQRPCLRQSVYTFRPSSTQSMNVTTSLLEQPNPPLKERHFLSIRLLLAVEDSNIPIDCWRRAKCLDKVRPDARHRLDSIAYAAYQRRCIGQVSRLNKLLYMW